MVITTLEGRVPQEKTDLLRKTYREMGINNLPPQIYESFLVQSADDPMIWRIMTVWKSREELEAYRKSGVTPTGILIFREVSVEPTLNIFTVAEHGAR